MEVEETIIDAVYEELRKGFTDNWYVEKNNNELILRYESPYIEENMDVRVAFEDDKVIIQALEAESDEAIDPVCASQSAYDECLNNDKDEDECYKAAEKAEKHELNKLDALMASDKPYIKRESNDCSESEHNIYIPARAFTVMIQLPNWDIERITNLIVNIVNDVARS